MIFKSETEYIATLGLLVLGFIVFVTLIFLFGKRMNKYFAAKEKAILTAASENRQYVVLATVAILVGSTFLLLQPLQHQTYENTHAAPLPTLTPTLTPTVTPVL